MSFLPRSRWATLLLSLLAGATAPGAERRRPNLVLIYTDDQDLDEIGCYAGQMPTPHMDSLARDGAKFTRYYVCSAVCSPSRYNALSGRCASRSLKQQGNRFPPGGPVNMGWEAGVINERHTLPAALRAAGYATGMVGKWHQGVLARPKKFPQNADPDDPQIRGQLAANYDNVVRSVKSCGFDYAASVYSDNCDGARGDAPFWIPRKLGFHNMEWVTAGALAFLEQQRKGPFFLYMAPTLVHSPSALAALGSDPRTTPLGYVDAPQVQPARQTVIERAEKASAGKPRQFKEKAASSIWLDDAVGAVLKNLDELGLSDNTLVLLASDNGNAAKFTCYDGGARLPCLARWKGVVPAGAVCDKLVSNLDFAPTFLELAGARPPADMILDGQSIVKAIRGDSAYRRDSLFLEITTERAVVSDDGFKYIATRYLPEILPQVRAGKRFNHWCQPMESATHTYNADQRYPAYFDLDQLYDLKADPTEQKNLASAPNQQARLAALKERLRQYSARLPHTFGEFKTK